MTPFRVAREAKSLTDVIFEHAPIGIATVARDGILSSANPRFLEIHGEKAKINFIGSNVFEFPFYREAGVDVLIRKVFEGKPFNVEVRFTSFTGARESFRRYIGMPIESAGGDTIEFALLMVDDITDKKRLEEDTLDYVKKLKEEQSQLLASINSLPLGFIIINTKNNLLIKNEAIDRILQIPQFEGGDIFLRGDVSLIEERLKGSFDFREKCERCVQEKLVIDVKEVAFGGKFLRILLTPVVVTGSREVIGVVILIDDITEAKILERSREEFFSIASHELRTPLTAIKGNTSMILDFYASKIQDEDVRQMLADIFSASERLIKIVNDFLEMSRLEQGRVKIEKTAFDIGEVAKGVIQGLSELATKKGLELRFDVAKAPQFSVLADRDRVKQVLTNLIGNAINYTTRGSITVMIEKLPVFLKVCVKDTGVGISQQNQQLLFRKFQQAGENILTRDVTQSTGLGLYISKLIVEAMGGEIKLEESILGEGSTFSFTLPTSNEGA